MKPKLIIKSLSELPANALALAVSMPGRAANATRDALRPPVNATRREIRAARRRSMAFMQSLVNRAQHQFQQIQPWSRGGLNE